MNRYSVLALSMALAAGSAANVAHARVTDAATDPLQHTRRMLEAHPNAAFDPEAILVRFAPNATAAQRNFAMQLVGGSKLQSWTIVPGLEQIKVSVAAKDAVVTLTGLPGIMYVELDYFVHADVTPNDPSFTNLWGCHNTGQTVKAIKAYQQALRINPDDADAWVNLGLTYSHADQTTKAIEAYQQALRINPDDAGAWYNLGTTYSHADQTAKAIEAYQQALRIDPDNAAAWYNLGVEFKFSGESQRVMEVYRRLKALDPAFADKFFNKMVLP